MTKDKRGPGRPTERMTDKPMGKRVSLLRKKGLSFSAIGAVLGIHRQHAHKIYHRVLAEKAT